MNQAIRKLSGLLVLPVLLAALLLMPVRASAAEYACDAEIPVSVELNGDHDEQFHITIEAKDGAPKADQTELLIRGDETASFTGIHFTAPGDYEYEVKQTVGSTDYMTYDTKVYKVIVQVTNEQLDDGSYTLDYTVYAWTPEEEGDQEAKIDGIRFLNTYAPPAPPAPTPTATPVPEEDPAAPTATPAASLLPQTGDDLPVTALAALAVAAVVLFIVLAVRRKRQK